MNTLTKIIKQFFAISFIFATLICSSLKATVPNLSNLCLNTLQHLPKLREYLQNHGELSLEIKEKIQKIMPFENTQTLQEHQKSFSSVMITPDGKTIITGFDDKTVKVFIKQNNDQFTEFQTLNWHQDFKITTPDGNTTITRPQYGLAKIWLKQNDGQLSEFKTLHINWILLFSAATNQNTIVTKDYCNVIVKNYQSRNIQTLRGHADYILSVAITPDSNIIVSGSKDKTAKVWVKQNDQFTEFQELRGHQGEVYFIDIVPKGNTIVTASKDEVKIWIKPNLN